MDSKYKALLNRIVLQQIRKEFRYKIRLNLHYWGLLDYKKVKSYEDKRLSEVYQDIEETEDILDILDKKISILLASKITKNQISERN